MLTFLLTVNAEVLQIIGLDSELITPDSFAMRLQIVDLLFRMWYPLLTSLHRGSPVTFLNCGYTDSSQAAMTGLSLATQDEADRPFIQLYQCAVRPIRLRDLEILEVSCGHGGGASYVARYHKPASIQAVDRNGRAIEFCQRRHHVAGLRFFHGDAMNLDFAAEASFDAVLNIEASHCYPNMGRFLREVARVLREGGHFLYADFRAAGKCDSLRECMEKSGLEVVEFEDISQGVIESMRLSPLKYRAWLPPLIPKSLRKSAKRFVGVEGSRIYWQLQSGEARYVRYVLRKN